MQAVRISFVAILISTSWRAFADETPALAESPAANPVAAITNAANAAITNSPTASLTNDASLLMDVRVKIESGPGQIPASRAYVTVGTNRFAFLVPGGFNIDTSDAQRVTLVRTDSACLLTIRILEAVAEPGLTAAECREKIVQEHPACTIDGEFSLGAGNSSGPAFEIRWKADGGVHRAARIAYVPMRGGVVEFSLDSNPDKFGAMLGHLNYVMLTFRASDPNGKIEPTPLYDRI